MEFRSPVKWNCKLFLIDINLEYPCLIYNVDENIFITVLNYKTFVKKGSFIVLKNYSISTFSVHPMKHSPILKWKIEKFPNSCGKVINHNNQF